MKRILVCVALAASSAFAQDTARMDEVVRAQTAGDKFMGNVLVAKGDEVVFARSYGWANLEWKVPHTAESKFRLGSVTKQFTAAAILLLAERGQLKLDDPVANYLPDPPPAWKAVTLLHLLTHTSGIPNFTAQPGYKTWKLSPETPADEVNHLRALPLEFEPGAKFSYSNTNYIVLGWVVERVAQMPYADFLQQNIFEPLGMKDTGYDSNATIIPHRAAGYAPAASGLANAAYVDMHVPGGAGALYATTGDLLRWEQGLFGGKLLSPASLERMTTPVKGDYACGLAVHTVSGRKVIEHGGGIEGFNSHLAYYPDTKTTVVVLANVNGPASQLAAQLAAVEFGEPVKLTSERNEIEVPVDTLRKYVGVYQLMPRITNTIRLTDDGHLTTQLTGQAALPLFAESPTKFFLKIVDAQMEFSIDDSGRVPDLIQYQNGRTIKAPRISDTVVERQAIDLPAADMQKYVGVYELAPNFALTITLEDGHLMSQATRQGKHPLFAESPGKFFLKVVDAQIEFVTDAAGNVTQLILHQGGRDMPGKRQPDAARSEG